MGAVEAGADSWFPTGIVLLPVPPATAVPRQRPPVEPQQPRQDQGTGRWTIVDATGAQVGAWPTRRQAMADLGRLGLRGDPLPLLVHGPDGLPTGDRLG